MSKFNAKSKTTTRTVNRAGGQAFKMSPQVELVHGTLTTFLDDKYYESGADRMTRLQELIGKNDPDFVAKLAVIARKEFHLRSVSHLLLGELALTHNGDDLIKRATVKFAERPDDLLEFASYVMEGTETGNLTKQAKRGIRNALLKFDSYQLAKYRGEGKEVSLVDLFNIAHPNAAHATKEQREAWDNLMKGKLSTAGKTWESNISNAQTDEERTEQWEKMINEGSIGYMALLRNLNNLVKYNVSTETLRKAADIIRDPERVRTSKQLPFRFYTAYQNVRGERILSDAISEALDHSVVNAPVFDGRTLIAVDASGSMNGWGSQGAIVNASLLAAALAKKNPGSDVILYDTSVVEFPVSGRTPVMDIMSQMQSRAMGGGTNTGVVFNYAEKKGDRYDRIIILSDNESWQDSYYGNGTQGELLSYLKATGADPYIFAIDIQGYGTQDISHPKAFHVAGWSDRILDFIGQVEKSESLVQYVKNYEI